MEQAVMSKRPKRIAMYVIYDKDGILDGYRKYYLQELRKVVDCIVGVVSGTLTPESREELSELTDEFFVRENKGLLAGSWIDGIQHIGWDKLGEYDELLMLNDSFFGPFYPLEDMMNAAEKSDADFYGAMKNFEEKSYTQIAGRPLKHGHFRGSICYFYIIKNKLLHSTEFKKYWSALPEVKEDWDTYFYAEIDFFDYVKDAGFKIDAYQGDKYQKFMFNNLTHNMFGLVASEKIPFARIRPFTNDLSGEQFTIGYGKDPRQTLEYIDECTEYNTDYIWKYLLRTKNIFTLHNQLQLEYVLPKHSVEFPANFNEKIAAIIHIYYIDQIDTIIKYCKNFPQNTDFYISTTDKKKAELIRKKFLESELSPVVKIRPNVGMAMSTLWVTFSNILPNYKYICYFHDKKSNYSNDEVIGQQFAERCFENLIGTKEIIENILGLFEKNARLGLVGAPEPYHGYYFSTLINAWMANYANAKKLAEEMNLKVDIQESIPPKAPLGDMFWFRTDALEKILEMQYTYEDFDVKYYSDGTKLHALERLYAYIAQDAGYFYAEVINNDEARSDLVNFKYMVSQFLWAITSSGVYPNSFYSAVNSIKSLENGKVPKRLSLKRKIKQRMPNGVWNVLKKIYHIFGGKKWIG